MTVDPDVWGPRSGRGRLCVDTSGLFAYVYPDDRDHDRARAFFEWLAAQRSVPWRLFVNDFVVDELLTLLVRKSDRRTAIRALAHVRDSAALTIVRVPDPVFETAMDDFAVNSDQEIPFTDHVVSAHADEQDANVYTFDRRDFDTLGNDVIPRQP